MRWTAADWNSRSSVMNGTLLSLRNRCGEGRPETPEAVVDQIGLLKCL